VPADPRELVEAMRYAAIGGGKRCARCWWPPTPMYGVDREAAVRAGVALEAIHVYSLIHDDLPCMDNDDLRHGKPTVHKAFDEATAVLAGDSLHCFAFEVLADPAMSGDPFVRVELIQVLATAAGSHGMAGGQMMDIVAETATFDLPTVTRLQQLKTGALLAAAVEMGAMLGKVPHEGRTHLRAYARDIGLAFQIADDLLDHEGDEEAAGKALRKDADKGKETFVSLLAPSVRASRRACWWIRRSAIWPAMARRPTCCANWPALSWSARTDAHRGLSGHIRPRSRWAMPISSGAAPSWSTG
jgi:farnesyl diphosphate synthase